MENKLVFEPTTLTQYQWNKYNLLTTYTYYWQVHQAIADYMTRYTWSKNEVLPDDVPSWDRYTAVDEMAPKYYWLQYNVVENPMYYYRKLRMNTTNHYTFTWNKAKTDYWYNYTAVGAAQVNKYTVKKYAAADTQTPQTYYYYDKYAVFRDRSYGGGTSYYEPFLGYRKVYEVVGYTIRPHQDGMIASITPEGIEPQNGTGYKVALYYESGTTWQNPTFSKQGACPYSSTTGNPSGIDAYSSYHQYYPYGSTNLDSNTSGFRDLMYDMAMKAKNGYLDGKALKAVYYIKDTNGNFYGFTPYTYFDWDDGLVHNVVKLTFSLLQNSTKKTCILCCPFKEAGFEYTPNTLNFYDGYVDENETPASAWDWCYIVRNNTGKNLPAVSMAEFDAPDSYKFITTTPLATPIDEPRTGYTFHIRHLKSNNTWNHTTASQGGFSYFKVVDYCYKKESVAKEKSGNQYTTETILLHYDNLDDSQEHTIFDFPINNMLYEYYDSQNDVWVEIDVNSRQDFAVNQQQFFIVHKTYSFNDYKTLHPYSTGTVIYANDDTYWTNALVLTYVDEGWVDETSTIYQLNISFPGNTYPQPKASDYYPDDGRRDGYHYVYVSTTNNPTYSSSGYVYGDEVSSTTQKDTSTVYFEASNNEPYKWYLNRTGSYQTAGTYIDYIEDWNQNAYPHEGVKGSYFYRYGGYQDEPTGNYAKGTFINEVVSSRSDTYPQDGYQDGFWYVYYGTVNTEYKYVYQKPTIYDIYETRWYIYIPKNTTAEIVEYAMPDGTLPTTVYWLDTNTFYNANGFWDDESFYVGHPTNVYALWIREKRHLGTLAAVNYDRYIPMPNWYTKIGFPKNINIKTVDNFSDTLTSGANLYDMKVFAHTYGGKGISGWLVNDYTNEPYNDDFIESSFGVQRPYIITYQTVPIPGSGGQTISGWYPHDLDTISTPWMRGLKKTGNTYTGYGTKYYSYRGSDDANYLNAGYVYTGIEENENPDYVYQYIEDVQSFVPGSYPDGDIAQDGYYYEITNTEDVIMSYHKGAFIENLSSSNPDAYQDNYVDFENRYYTYSHADAHYSKGGLVDTVSSYIESSYPQDSYVVNDAWYTYIGNREFIVGQMEINKSQLMGGVNYTQEINPSEDLMIGAGGAAQVDFTIYAPDANAATQYLGKDFTYYVKMASDSDWRQVGVFTLTKAELPDKQTAKIEGFDYIYKFDTVIDGWLDSLTFPMTLGNLFNSLCQYVGCEAYSTEFNNSTFIVNDNFEAVQITGRTILQYITEVSGGFCVAEPDGRIHIKQYSIPPTGTINLGNDSYVKYTHEIYNVPVITSVVVRKDDEDEGVESNV